MPPLILVVDDEPDIREILADVLADEGYRVATARDGREALEQLGGELPDLILSDVTMPRMDGVTLVRRLCERGVAVPVVLISATYGAVDLPGVRFVPKPFALDAVLAVVARCLGGG